MRRYNIFALLAVLLFVVTSAMAQRATVAVQGTVVRDVSGDPLGKPTGYQAHDEMLFLHVGHRYYDSANGRFLQRDHIGITIDRNVYANVLNLPTLLIDPEGLGCMRNQDITNIINNMPPPPPSGDAGNLDVGIGLEVSKTDAKAKLTVEGKLRDWKDLIDRGWERFKTNAAFMCVAATESVKHLRIGPPGPRSAL